jgi:hypothetical protein
MATKMQSVCGEKIPCAKASIGSDPEGGPVVPVYFCLRLSGSALQCKVQHRTLPQKQGEIAYEASGCGTEQDSVAEGHPNSMLHSQVHRVDPARSLSGIAFFQG